MKRYQTHASIGFLRALDDSLDVNGLGIRRTVLWNDANGSPFVLSSLPQLAGWKLLVEDLTG